MDQLRTLQHQLQRALDAQNYEGCRGVLDKLKHHLSTTGLLLPRGGESDAPVREVLEMGAVVSIHLLDSTSFQRYWKQLGPFYRVLGHSANWSKLMGLQLLLLLAESKIAEFHTEYERLGDEEVVRDNQFLAYPLRLQEWLMEGSYDKVWRATRQGMVPAEEYRVFSPILVDSMRNEIAQNAEKAYLPSIPLRNAQNLLFLDDEAAAVQFAASRGWRVDEGRVFFGTQEALEERDDERAIANTLLYARELETIV